MLWRTNSCWSTNMAHYRLYRAHETAHVAFLKTAITAAWEHRLPNQHLIYAGSGRGTAFYKCVY